MIKGLLWRQTYERISIANTTTEDLQNNIKNKVIDRRLVLEPQQSYKELSSLLLEREQSKPELFHNIQNKTVLSVKNNEIHDLCLTEEEEEKK